MSDPCTREDLPHVLIQIGRLSEALKAEFDLVGTRMTWLVTSQAFLFTAFATAASNVKDDQPLLLSALKFLVCAIPVVATAIAVLVALALHAAHSVAVRIKNDRDKLILTLPERLQIRLVSSRDKEHSRGNLPAVCIPWILASAWVGAVLSLPMPPW